MPGVAVGNLALMKYGYFTCRNAAVGNSLVAFQILNSGASATALTAYPTGEALEIVSTSPEDDAGTPGTGMLTARVIYLDGTTGTIATLTVSLDGTGVVALSDTTIARVLEVHGLTFGSAGAAVGTVTIQTVAGDIGRIAVDPGFRSAFPGRFTIPDGYTGYYRGFDIEHGNTATTPPVRIDYLIRADLASNTGLLSTNNFIDIDVGVSAVASAKTGAGRPSSVHGQNMPLPAGTTITALARTDTAGTIVVAGRVYIELTNKEI